MLHMHAPWGMCLPWPSGTPPTAPAAPSDHSSILYPHLSAPGPHETSPVHATPPRDSQAAKGQQLSGHRRLPPAPRTPAPSRCASGSRGQASGTQLKWQLGRGSRIPAQVTALPWQQLEAPAGLRQQTAGISGREVRQPVTRLWR
ncbi:hypothetical protein HaLaN_23204 [Haematococcus lacustris]|uniref:Uncharacterized protein n=1 Tax=Haematococcus lacustris TaxID=44745 RepID=A0A699ZR38_HAELA|nr:hypothetical protein HaLaN_23204 [Haematococcus lacustris]